MMDPITLRMWLYRLLLLTLVGVITFVLLLPMTSHSVGFPGPDLLLALIFAWVIRRPEYVPVLLVAGIVFLTDMLFQAPPGLHTALVVIGLEFLRARSAQSQDIPFLFEWGLVMVVLVAVLLGERLVLSLVMVDQVSFGQSVLRLIMTLLAYPVIVAISVYTLNVRRVQPGEADALRQGL